MNGFAEFGEPKPPLGKQEAEKRKDEIKIVHRDIEPVISYLLQVRHDLSRIKKKDPTFASAEAHRLRVNMHRQLADRVNIEIGTKRMEDSEAAKLLRSITQFVRLESNDRPSFANSKAPAFTEELEAKLRSLEISATLLDNGPAPAVKIQSLTGRLPRAERSAIPLPEDASKRDRARVAFFDAADAFLDLYDDGIPSQEDEIRAQHECKIAFKRYMDIALSETGPEDIDETINALIEDYEAVYEERHLLRSKHANLPVTEAVAQRKNKLWTILKGTALAILVAIIGARELHVPLPSLPSHEPARTRVNTEDGSNVQSGSTSDPKEKAEIEAYDAQQYALADHNTNLALRTPEPRHGTGVYRPSHEPATAPELHVGEQRPSRTAPAPKDEPFVVSVEQNHDLDSGEGMSVDELTRRANTRLLNALPEEGDIPLDTDSGVGGPLESVEAPPTISFGPAPDQTHE